MRTVRVTVCLGAMLALVASARANVIAWDPFMVGGGGYSPSDIVSQGPAVAGFTGAWQQGTNPTGTFHIDDVGLDHPVQQAEAGGTATYVGNAVVPQRVYRSLASYSAPADPPGPVRAVYYMSGLISAGSTIVNDGLTVMGFTNQQTLSDSEFFSATADHGIEGLQWGFHSHSSQIDLVLRHRKHDGADIRQQIDVLAGGVTVGQMYLVILKLEMDGEAAPNDDRVSVWVNPLSVASEGAAGAAQVFADCSLSDVTAIDALVLAKNPLLIPVGYDEPRFGTTWASVTLVPEPATVALLGMAALAWRRPRRRRKR